MGAHWKTSMNVGALVTLVAAVHYFYMREYWVQIGRSPIVYRYIDWSITVPLQMIEFYFILSAVQPNLSSGMFWRLLVGTVAMLAFVYAGETGKVAASGDKVGENVRSSFETMRFIVSVGWSIYPLGYFFGYLCGSVSDEALNVVYNIADVINKIAFCLAIWSSAKKDPAEKRLLA